MFLIGTIVIHCNPLYMGIRFTATSQQNSIGFPLDKPCLKPAQGSAKIVVILHQDNPTELTELILLVSF